MRYSLSFCSIHDRYRDMHGISADEHQEVLRQHNWKEEEYEAGFQKGAPPRDGSKYFLKYEALVRRELAKGEVSKHCDVQTVRPLVPARFPFPGVV